MIEFMKRNKSEETTIFDAITLLHFVNDAIKYDPNDCAPTSTLKENVFYCLTALNHRGCLNFWERLAINIINRDLIYRTIIWNIKNNFKKLLKLS